MNLTDKSKLKWSTWVPFELLQRVKKHIEYSEKIQDHLFLYFTIGFLGIVFLGAMSVQIGFPSYTWVIALIPYTGFIAILQRYWKNKFEEYPVETEEWARYYTNDIHSYISMSLESKARSMKKKYQKKALSSAKDFLNCIRKYWKIGPFKPAREYAEKAVNSLIENLSYAIIPAFKTSNEELLGKVQRVMYLFHKEADSFTVDTLEVVNKEIQTSLSLKKPAKIGYKTRITVFLQSHKVARFFAVSSILGVIYIIFGIILSYFDISKEFIVSISVVLFGILVETYLRIKGKTD